MSPSYTVFMRHSTGKFSSTLDATWKRWYAEDPDCQKMESGLTGKQAQTLMSALRNPKKVVALYRKVRGD